MIDESNLDNKYFIDDYVFNCPFCNRRNVVYYVKGQFKFDWSSDKECYCYLVYCASCGKVSMHLSFYYLTLQSSGYLVSGKGTYHFSTNLEERGLKEMDDAFFYSIPTSFFVIDKRIPKILRELFSEAEGCLKSNYLTGASACARKIIYELTKLENGTGNNYEERIKSLKLIHPEIDPTFFDTLLSIQQITSDKVHEDAYDEWESSHIKIILFSMSKILYEIYVLPEIRKQNRQEIINMQDELLKKKSKPKTA